MMQKLYLETKKSQSVLLITIAYQFIGPLESCHLDTITV